MTAKPYYRNNHDWQKFFREPGLVEFFSDTIEETWIPSGPHEIHLDIYRHKHDAPTLVYLHGLSSSGRLMGPLVKFLFELGYNIICPDLIGFGMTTQKYGSGTIKTFVQNAIDTVEFARREFSGPVFLGGISMGGGLSYYAAAAGARVSAIACYCLMDFGDPTTWKINSQGALLWGLFPLLALGRWVLPNLYLPMRTFLDAHRLCEDDYVVNLFKTNPLAVRHYTFRAAMSILCTKPAIPLGKFDRVPVLVLHAQQDRLIPEWVSQYYYEKIPGRKRYVSINNCGHVPVNREQIVQHTAALDQWFQETDGTRWK